MEKQIFRKKSIDRVNSPEQLNEYICVASPSVWLVLGAITVFLAGFCVWSVFGTIDTKEKAVVEVSGGVAAGFLPARSGQLAENGMKVIVGGTETSVAEISSHPFRLDSSTNPYVYYLGGFSEGDFCFGFVLAENTLPDGVYEAEIVTESINPIRFVIQ